MGTIWIYMVFANISNSIFFFQSWEISFAMSANLVLKSPDILFAVDLSLQKSSRAYVHTNRFIHWQSDPSPVCADLLQNY
jgi:hypothetical protein